MIATTVEAATQDRQLVEYADAQSAGHSWRSLADKPQHGQSGGQPDGNDDHADALHDCNRAQIASELGTKRQHLRHASGSRSKVRVDIVPTMNETQISRTTNRNEGHG